MSDHAMPATRGVKGDKGETGDARLPFRLAWSLIILFTVAFLIAGSSLILTSHEISQNDHKWCATINLLLAQPPPSGSAANNPSRAYEQKLYADFTKLRGQLGCDSGR